MLNLERLQQPFADLTLEIAIQLGLPAAIVLRRGGNAPLVASWHCFLQPS
jgi:hypothetical protein